MRGNGAILKALEKEDNQKRNLYNNPSLRHIYLQQFMATLQPYKNPYEDQRKKYYAEILAKPWGQVSKKYIDALEAEEKGLIAEFLAITGMSEAQWAERKSLVFVYINENFPLRQNQALKGRIKDRG